MYEHNDSYGFFGALFANLSLGLGIFGGGSSY